MLRRDPAPSAVPLRPVRFVLTLGAGALVVAVLTTAGLAATEAGFAAIPHAPGEEPFELILPGMHGPH
jgi:hypothetical protein